MSYRKIFDTTTSTRSSHIGQPGYNSNDDWAHFCEKYQQRCLRFAKARFPQYPDLANDAFQEVAAKIVVNPNILIRKTSKHFRSVIATLVRDATVNLIRQQKPKQFRRYVEQTAALRTDIDTQGRELHRLRRLAVDLIYHDLLREDYENGRFTREFDALDLDIWRARQREGANDSSVAKEMGFSSGNKVKGAVGRVDERIRQEAEALLASLGLI